MLAYQELLLPLLVLLLIQWNLIQRRCFRHLWSLYHQVTPTLLSFSFHPFNLSFRKVLAAMDDQRFPCRLWPLLPYSSVFPTLIRSLWLRSFLLQLLFFAFAALDLARHDGYMEATAEPHLSICMIG